MEQQVINIIDKELEKLFIAESEIGAFKINIGMSDEYCITITSEIKRIKNIELEGED